MSFISLKNKRVLLLTALGLHSQLQAGQDERCDELTATGNSEYPPFLWRKNIESNQLLGTNRLIINEISQRLGKSIELKHTGPWSRAQREVKSGRIDLMAGVFYTRERSQYLDYIEPAFLQTQSVVWTNNVPSFDYQNEDSLKGKLGVTVINNSFGQRFDQFAKKNLELTYVASVEQAFRMLLGHRVDYVVYEEAPGEAYIQEIWNFFPFQVQQPAVSREHLYLAFSRNSPCNTKGLREDLAGIMKGLSDEGFFNEINQKGRAQWLLK
ncbi:ABC transporter substrate-binding protein [Marinomonas sp. 42_23_T18]|nr:ABC transporter substrate-binding protein [Marinomonas sp. 42_23_T18]